MRVVAGTPRTEFVAENLLAVLEGTFLVQSLPLILDHSLIQILNLVRYSSLPPSLD